MQLAHNTVLVTGGASGIGLALAQRFLGAGNEVIVCGRREEVLSEAKARFPALHTRVCDVGDAEQRESLFEWVARDFPALNVLVNNAGIQRRIDLSEPENWSQTRSELAINLEAPIHLSQLFLPHLRRQPRAAILNVSSGLAFAPIAAMPIYCASKAALHSFTLSLRQQLSSSSVEVIEIIPPAVNTDLGGPGLHTFGEPLDEFADDIFARLGGNELEIAYGTAAKASRASRDELDQAFAAMNS
ncbi:MAG TPA: SDR family oxidoreductase [Abditibacterium sp.]|jgi:uncharacterized oxidoreductase